jgi:hypothetical protein
MTNNFPLKIWLNLTAYYDSTKRDKIVTYFEPQDAWVTDHLVLAGFAALSRHKLGGCIRRDANNDKGVGRTSKACSYFFSKNKICRSLRRIIVSIMR